MTRIRDGEDGRRLADAQDFVEDAAGAHAQVDDQNAVHILQSRLDPADRLGRGDNLIDDEVDVRHLVAELGELGFVGANLILEAQLAVSARALPSSPCKAGRP